MPEVARHRRSVGVEVLQDFFKASQPFQKVFELLTAITLLYFYFTLYFVSGEESFGHIHYVHGSIFRHAELQQGIDESLSGNCLLGGCLDF